MDSCSPTGDDCRQNDARRSPQKLSQDPKDQNTYILGSIYGHNVAIACLPSGVYGTVSAAVVAAQMLTTVRALRFILMVGIGGGVPNKRIDIRLGDVVVSKPSDTSGGIIQYDYGKTVEAGRFQRTGSLNKPPQVLLTAISELQESNIRGTGQIPTYLSEIGKKYPKMRQFLYCGHDFDDLYESEYDHVGAETCEDCDRTKLIARTPRASNDPQIHCGLIASGDQVMKHGATRDRLAQDLGILCFEMEAAGLMDQFPCLVIRGICDYSDSHKNKRWQEYAATAAAVYARELLSAVSIQYVLGAPRVQDSLSLAMAMFAGSIVGFLGVSNSIMASLCAGGTTEATSGFVKDIALQLPVLVECIKKIASDCKDNLITEENQRKLLPVASGCLEQITFLDKLIQTMLPASEDSWLRRVRKSTTRFRKGTVVYISLRTLENYKSTVLVHLEQTAQTKMKGLCTSTEMREGVASVQRQNIEMMSANWLKPFGMNCVNTPHLPGTCEWIWTDPVFVEWFEPSRKEKSERLLCLHGINGCGKSVLAASIVKEFKKKSKKLSQEISDDKALRVIQRLRLENPITTVELFEALLEIAKPLAETVYCMIDGLDESVEECNDRDHGLLRHILEILDLENFHVALFARSRALQTAMEMALTIEINSSNVRADLERFIRSQIGNTKIFKTPSLQDHVLSALLEESDGMFLWVKIMIEDLRKSATSIELMERLQDMPRGMERLYRLRLKRLQDSLDDRELTLARKVFAFTIAARRLLTVDELQHCYALSIQSNSALEDRFLLQAEVRISAVCGDLVNITNGRVQIIHNSIKEFLTRPSNQWLHNDDQKIRYFQVDARVAHLSLRNVCLDYLLMDRWELSPNEPESVFNPEKHPFAEYSSKYGLPHLLRSGQPQEPILNKMNIFSESHLFSIWVDYVGMTVFEDPSPLFELEELHNWLKLSDHGTDLRGGKLQHTFQLLHRRIEDFREDYTRTGWLLTFDRLKESIQQKPETGIQVIPEDPKDPSAVVAQIINVVKHQGKLQILRRLDLWVTLSLYLGQAKALTDPLRLLFEAIVGIADKIPVVLFLAIGKFYERIDKLDEAIKIYHTALSKITPDQEIMESNILEFISHIDYQRKNYENAEDACRQALSLGETKLGRQHHQTLRLIGLCGIVLHIKVDMRKRKGCIDER
ncbi:hypothetical protein TWF694_003342 [Orbilia ellipsospora]|uniref:Nucleoside phosphorylase domain-containing protein n=1 Tax=Orbilia ellipsospora TaxID=2528407 RepID=A0AAV9X3T2_9PEZI